MEQQIIPSASAQTTSAANKAASVHGKSDGKGLFAKLLAIIEGKADTGAAAGSEKLFTHKVDADAANTPVLKTGKAGAIPFITEKPAVQKAAIKQKESSDVGTAETAIDIKKPLQREARLIAAGQTGDLKNSTADKAAEAANATVKAKSRPVPEIAQRGTAPAANSEETVMTAKADAAARVKPGFETAQKTTPAADNEEVAITDKSDSTAKSKSGAETVHRVATPAADNEEVAITSKADAAAKTKAVSETAHKATAPVVGTANMVIGAKAESTVKAKAGSDVAHMAPAAHSEEAAMTPKAESEALRTATPAADRKEVAATVQTDAAAKARPETTHRITASEQSKDSALITPGKSEAPGPIAKNGPAVSENVRRIEGMKTTAQQPMAISMQSEKGMFMQPEAALLSGASEQQRFSTNSFIKSRKINLDHSAKAKTSSLQAGAEKKPEMPIGNAKLPSIQPAESFASNIKDVMAQAETLSRSGQQTLDSANGQTFQASSLEATSTLMRSAHQPIQTLPGSGPWTVAAAMQQIGQQAATQGKFKMELTLTPEHLGKVQVFVDSDVNRQIQVHLVVDQATSRQSIEQHLPVLKQALADQGLNMDSFSMASSEQGNGNQQQQQQSHHLPSETTIANSHSGGEQRPPVTADSRLSIRI